MLMKFYGGLDFGTSGARISIINESKKLIYTNAVKYENKFEDPRSWIISCEELLKAIPIKIKKYLSRLSISGTSGTLVACSLEGKSLGNALPYNKLCSTDKVILNSIAKDNHVLKDPYSSLAKALHLFNLYGDNILIRHQVDWITGWLLNNWVHGEEGNNLKLGWDIKKKEWPKNFNSISWFKSLPVIIKSGKVLGKLNKEIIKRLKLNPYMVIVAGTTDSNASFLASQITQEEGLTVLGTTMVLKKSIKEPIKKAGITSHRINNKWICGGASNAGCGILSKFFSDKEIEELSKQINPKQKTNLNYLPLNSKGERFPVNDPFLEPKIRPRPISDSLFLHALFEGLASIELKGWERLKEITGALPTKIVTIGGGSKNPQWRSIREKIIKIPIVTCNKTTSYGSAILALSSTSKK